MKGILLVSSLMFVGFIFAVWEASHGNQSEPSAPRVVGHEGLPRATFAGGCFWCTESDFEKLDGVVDVISGYTGGEVENPSYQAVSSGSTGHVEAVQIIYDPARITYKELLDYFWRHVDPTDADGQFVDRGAQYLSAIFYQDDEQKRLAEESKRQLEMSGRFKRPIATRIIRFTKFYPAEDYHQDYYKKNPIRYNLYRFNSGRDQFLARQWGKEEQGVKEHDGSFSKPSREILRDRLSSLQYKVTQESGTEPAFHNEYWDNKREGIYVDVVSGEPLFSSGDKYDSGTGWPSFTRPLEPGNLVEKKDTSLFFMPRMEVRSKNADSHLGHVFNDGPPPTGLRYCMNSAALRFVPRDELEKEGYGRYLKLFSEEDQARRKAS